VLCRIEQLTRSRILFHNSPTDLSPNAVQHACADSSLDAQAAYPLEHFALGTTGHRNMHDQDEDYTRFEREESAPVDMLAALFEARGWVYEITSDDEITAEFKGSWTSYQIRAIAREEDNALQLLALPDVTVPIEKREAVYTALGLINEQLWIGHFDMWSSNGILLFRHGTLLPPNGLLNVDQAQTIIDVAIDECERFYPVFQFIIWGDKTPEDAIASALVETHGEA
jgi:hypothetical protein